MHLHLPLDFDSWPEFRRLKAVVGQAQAVNAFVRLFVELGHLAQVAPLGEMDAAAVALVADGIGESGKELFAEMVKAGLVVERDGGWYCPRFARTQPHLDPSHVPMQKKGNMVSNYTRGLQKFSQSALQQSLLIPQEVWTGPDGAKIDSETQRKVMLLIRASDNALKLPDRAPESYTEGLVQDALRILAGWSGGQIDVVFKWVLLHRDHPAVPRTTEQLLPRFAEVVKCAGGSICA